MQRIRIERGDITRIPVDAIVNAANSALAGGGGVDGAIHRAAGGALMQELDVIREREGGCPTGSAVVTSAGEHLPAKFVFHAVGPVYKDGRHGEPELLASCYRTCLKLAVEHGARTISFPAISTGVYGYPAEQAAEIAVREVKAFLQETTPIDAVIFVVFDAAAERAYKRLLG